MENKKIKIDLGFATLVVEAGNDQMKEGHCNIYNPCQCIFISVQNAYHTISFFLSSCWSAPSSPEGKNSGTPR